LCASLSSFCAPPCSDYAAKAAWSAYCDTRAARLLRISYPGVQGEPNWPNRRLSAEDFDRDSPLRTIVLCPRMVAIPITQSHTEAGHFGQGGKPKGKAP